MPKKKKTRKEKMVADVRRETSPMPVYSVSEVIVPKTKTTVPQLHKAPAAAIATTDYHYLSKDLLKTGIFTGVVIAAELAFYFFTKGV